MNQDSPLHSIARMIGQNQPSPTALLALGFRPDQDVQLADLLALAKQLLDQGANPNELIAQIVSPGVVSTHTPLGILGQKTRGSSNDAALDLAKLLIQAGANPLQEDMALGVIINEYTASLLNNEILAELARLETQGKGLRTKEGGNVLHHLGEVNPGMLTYLDEDVYNEQDGFPVYFDRALVNAQDTDGNTPLHRVWQTICQDGPGEMELAWKATRSLIEAGADPLIRNRKNLRAGEVIAQVLGGEPVPQGHQDAWGRIKALLDHQDLGTTPQATPTRTGPRL